MPLILQFLWGQDGFADNLGRPAALHHHDSVDLPGRDGTSEAEAQAAHGSVTQATE